MLHLALNPGGNFGWGICSRYLIQEVGRLTEIRVLSDKEIKELRSPEISGSVFHAIADHALRRQYPVRGLKNYGYTFFENLLEEGARENAGFFDIVFAGSTWCRERLEEKGIRGTDTLIQGVDPGLFFPIDFEKPSGRDRFIIFSGGKFELRKGQDLVLRAVKVLQEKYDDIILMALWFNPWRFSLETMKDSPHISFEMRGESWEEAVKHIMALNGMDPARNIVLPPINNNQLRSLYASTDIGVFPNRCEGGTNLVLMEYMACAKPVIASCSSGHRDVVTDQNALLLTDLKTCEVLDEGDRPVALWDEPDLDELISRIEYAYLNRNELKGIAARAGEDMKGFSWHATALDLLKKTGEA